MIIKAIKFIPLILIFIFFQNCSPFEGGFESQGEFIQGTNTGASGIDLTGLPAEKILATYDKGIEVFTNNCLGCHGANVELSEKRGLTVSSLSISLEVIPEMQHLKLDAEDIQSVVFALNNYRADINQKLSDQNKVISICKPESIKSSLSRRLNRNEYANTIKSYLNIEVDKTNLPKDIQSAAGYNNDGSSLLLSDDDGLKYLEQAKLISSKYIDSLKGKLSCPNDTNNTNISSCFEDVVKSYLFYAFRRPILPAEVTKYITIVEGEKTIESFEVILTAILVSPNFLFTNIFDKVSSGGTLRKLSGYSLASRLSFFLWSAAPDKQLYDLAASGTISNENVVSQQIDRMLSDKKADAFKTNFISKWLQFDSLAESPKSEDSVDFKSLVNDMKKETTLLFNYVLDNNLPTEELLTAKYTFINKKLADLYEMDTNLGTEFKKTFYTDKVRRGIATHASFLSNSHQAGASLIIRGATIMQRLMCLRPNTLVSPDEFDKQMSDEADVIQTHASNPKCASCHVFIDPFGAGLNSFDEFGRFRSSDGKSYGSSGALATGYKFNNAFEMAEGMAEGHEFQDCVAENIAIYAVGRKLTQNESCFLREMSRNKGSLGLKDLIKNIVLSKVYSSDKY